MVSQWRLDYYPGLTPEEASLWQWWLDTQESGFLEFWYNVHVGEGIPAQPASLADDPDLAARIAAQWKSATQRRIDVVGFRQGGVWVFEVERVAGMYALGQAVAYPPLLLASYPIRQKVYMAVVCDTIGQDLLTAYQAAGIFTWVRSASVQAVLPATRRASIKRT